MTADRATPPSCGYCGSESWTATPRVGRGTVRICDPCHEWVWQRMRTVDVDPPTNLAAAVSRYRERHGITPKTDEATGESLADALRARAGVGERQVRHLFEAGFDSRRAIESATVPELVDVDGIRPEDANRIVRAFDGPEGEAEDDDDEDSGLGQLFD